MVLIRNAREKGKIFVLGDDEVMFSGTDEGGSSLRDNEAENKGRENTSILLD